MNPAWGTRVPLHWCPRIVAADLGQNGQRLPFVKSEFEHALVVVDRLKVLVVLRKTDRTASLAVNGNVLRLPADTGTTGLLAVGGWDCPSHSTALDECSALAQPVTAVIASAATHPTTTAVVVQ